MKKHINTKEARLFGLADHLDKKSDIYYVPSYGISRIYGTAILQKDFFLFLK